MFVYCGNPVMKKTNEFVAKDMRRSRMCLGNNEMHDPKKGWRVYQGQHQINYQG